MGVLKREINGPNEKKKYINVSCDRKSSSFCEDEVKDGKSEKG